MELVPNTFLYDMSSSVCYAYTRTGGCRYGSRCKFAHVEAVDLEKRNNNSKRSQTGTPLEEFFAVYPKFEYDSSASASLEFYRLCDEFGWERNDEARARAHDDFKDAIVQQFNFVYGTDPNDLSSWRTLCQIVHVSPVPDTLKLCREAVNAVYVNIVDLVDTKATEEPVMTFGSEMELSQYTKLTGKFFPRDNAYAGGLLRYLLRRIMNPRSEVVSRRKK